MFLCQFSLSSPLRLCFLCLCHLIWLCFYFRPFCVLFPLSLFSASVTSTFGSQFKSSNVAWHVTSVPFIDSVGGLTSFLISMTTWHFWACVTDSGKSRSDVSPSLSVISTSRCAFLTLLGHLLGRSMMPFVSLLLLVPLLSVKQINSE
jgi:hypothetical protein